ncbi:unnamed protein product [Cylindrotheca closterium]|uniref:Uncharacterized protein n=1 Tax=Cylindrotheca closterium TaxID=2856 RepID=A0AAD2CTS8_9STRA|nr:unnamed protein product [Cylindrotheca closterium]
MMMADHDPLLEESMALRRKTTSTLILCHLSLAESFQEKLSQRPSPSMQTYQKLLDRFSSFWAIVEVLQGLLLEQSTRVNLSIDLGPQCNEIYNNPSLDRDVHVDKAGSAFPGRRDLETFMRLMRNGSLYKLQQRKAETPKYGGLVIPFQMENWFGAFSTIWFIHHHHLQEPNCFPVPRKELEVLKKHQSTICAVARNMKDLRKKIGAQHKIQAMIADLAKLRFVPNNAPNNSNPSTHAKRKAVDVVATANKCGRKAQSVNTPESFGTWVVDFNVSPSKRYLQCKKDPTNLVRVFSCPVCKHAKRIPSLDKMSNNLHVQLEFTPSPRSPFVDWEQSKPSDALKRHKIYVAMRDHLRACMGYDRCVTDTGYCNFFGKPRKDKKSSSTSSSKSKSSS